ncbi:DoxX family protein [Microvirga sp. CF3016]|uniref:DoxX family protein n=1 Tax=Microvirga sp. CF3016 TaxID=3110181 RepID=UPI002E76621C|nr:DoxX family protein [Microvirga sp. CF3016]MEE1610482.1 DoxX family protein [Microvirga sp. CF3016]
MIKLQAPVVLVARLMLAFIFIVEGWSKIATYEGTVQYMEDHGVPGQLLPLVIVTELGGGLLIAAGFKTRLAALALAGFCLLTALLFHRNIGEISEFIHFTKDLSIAGGFLLLVAFGAGSWSLDALQAPHASVSHHVWK